MAIVDVPGSLSSGSLLALIWACFSVSFLFVIARTAIRLRIMGRLATEDYWIYLAISTLLTNAVLQTIQLPSLYYITGVLNGVVMPSSTPELLGYGNDYVRFEFAIIGLFWTVLWCVKASFLAVYFKLFEDMPFYRITWYILAAFAFFAYVGCWVASFMTCHPISNYFVFGTCDQPADILVSRICVWYSTIVDILTDICIMAMPIKLIYSINISSKQKAGLIGVFGLCAVMIVFAVVRAKQLLVATGFVDLIMLETWSTLEASISVVVGCLPVFKSLITNRAASRLRNRGYNSYSDRSSRSKSNNPKRSNTSRSHYRNSSVPLESFSQDIKPIDPRLGQISDSQEDIVGSGMERDGNGIMVKNDVTVSYREAEMSHPPYRAHQPIPSDTSFRF